MIKKIILIGFWLGTLMVGLGQSLPKEKSANHIQIKGTNIFMIPPASFELSNNFTGFQNPNDSTSMIMTIEIPGPFAEISKGLNPEMLMAQGMKLISTKEMQVADLNGLLVEIDQPANGYIFTKQVLLYGDQQSSTLINGVYLKDSIQLGEQIKQSILSTFVDSTADKNPRDALSYQLNENVGSMRFKAVVGNGMLFNRDLKFPTQSEDRASLFTDKSVSKVDIKNKKLFCIQRLKAYPDEYALISSKGIKKITIDNLDGYQLFAKNNVREEEEMYQAILFEPNGVYYLLAGTYRKDSQKAFEDIQRVIKTFTRK